MKQQREPANTLEETLYQPHGMAFRPLWALSTAASEVAHSRYLIWSLFSRDFKVQFRQQILGYLWVILTPILGVASFVFMNYAGVLKPGDSGMPYPLYVFFGTSVWAVLVNSMQSVGNGLQQQADLLLRTNIPKIALAISTLASVLYNLLINFALILVVSLLFGFPPTGWALLYPLLLLPLLLVGVGIGLALSVINVIAKDITTMAVTLMGLVMYATPVIYVASSIENPALQALIHYNPLSHLIHLPRTLFYLGSSPQWEAYLLSTGFAALLFLLGVHFFYTLQDKVAERL